jgi:choline dehydrogenase-like flavoprotein
MTCLDIPADIRAEWASRHGLDGLDGTEWAADVAALETELGVSSSVIVPPKDELLRRGATALGWHAAVTGRNAADCGDCGSCPFGCRRGTKQSGLRVHLADAVARGARILDRARVLAIVRDAEGGVAGVRGLLAPAVGADEAESGEPRPFGIHARQVVLAAGALRSPAILQAAGIDHPAVGRHLRIHPVAVVGAILAEPVDMWRGTMQAVHSLEFGAEERGRRRYVVESAPGHLGLMALVVPWLGADDHAAEMARARHFAPLIAITRDGGEGRVSLTRAGRVRIDYRLDDLGRATLRHALGSMARIARAAGVEEILALGLPPARYRSDAGGDAGRDAEARFGAFLDAVARMSVAPNRIVMGSAHQMGTLRMGTDPVDHPADPRGRVRADRSGRVIRGLYVADGSTFPTGIGVNPMIGIMAMARRVSRTVLSEAPPR